MWNRYDIIEAYLSFFSNYHEGQNSLKYQRLSKILSYYTPSVWFRGYTSLSENGKGIYNELVKNEHKSKSSGN